MLNYICTIYVVFIVR